MCGTWIQLLAGETLGSPALLTSSGSYGWGRGRPGELMGSHSRSKPAPGSVHFAGGLKHAAWEEEEPVNK